MPAPPTDPRRRAYWLRKLHEWHWVSSAMCLVGMILFSATGLTLNHAGLIEARPQVLNQRLDLPPALREEIQKTRPANRADAPLPPTLARFLREAWQIDADGRPAEWSPEEIYLSLPRPGGDAWVRVSFDDGGAEYEKTDRGWISYLNDLHKGRHTGFGWSLFLDVFAVAALVFSVTGLLILKMHAANRPMTWPLTALGLVLPLLIALLLIH